MRVTGCVVVPIVLVVVLVLVIEKAEYVLKMRWGVEDEDESLTGCVLRVSSCEVRVLRLRIWECGFRIL